MRSLGSALWHNPGQSWPAKAMSLNRAVKPRPKIRAALTARAQLWLTQPKLLKQQVLTPKTELSIMLTDKK
jgi:hypothetical protein